MPNRHPAHAPIDGPKLDVQIVQAPERFMFNADESKAQSAEVFARKPACTQSAHAERAFPYLGMRWQWTPLPGGDFLHEQALGRRRKHG